MKQFRIMALALAATLLFGACKPKAEAPAEPASTDNIYQFTVFDGDSNAVDLSAYQGKVLLVVNTATQCGFTPQYEALQDLYTRFHGRGFEILDFPCNQFGAQAPGTNEEIHAFCTGTYNTTFPQMAKIDVNGPAETVAPLYTWLKAKAPFAGFDTTDRMGALLDNMLRQQDSAYDKNPDIKWNFTKFLVDREGNVVRRFEPMESMKSVEDAVAALL